MKNKEIWDKITPSYSLPMPKPVAQPARPPAKLPPKVDAIVQTGVKAALISFGAVVALLFWGVLLVGSFTVSPWAGGALGIILAVYLLMKPFREKAKLQSELIRQSLVEKPH